MPIAKAHGRKASLKKAPCAGEEACGQHVSFRGGAWRRGGGARALLEKAKEALPNAEEILFEQISPALVVHTGPGLIGIGARIIE